jgi:hypothetical protein
MQCHLKSDIGRRRQSRDLGEMSMPEQAEIEAQGRRVVDLFSACASAPDDPQAARSADEALWRLEEMLAAQDRGEAPETEA